MHQLERCFGCMHDSDSLTLPTRSTVASSKLQTLSGVLTLHIVLISVTALYSRCQYAYPNFRMQTVIVIARLHCKGTVRV